MNSVEILDKKSSLKEEIRSLINTAKAETRELTEEEQNRVDEIKKQIEALNKELEEIEKKNEVPTDENKEENKRNKTMKNDFSILKAIRSVVDNQPLDVASKAFIEAGREEMRNLNAEGQIQIPVETRTINITNTTTGEHDDIVSTDMMNVLEPLQHKLALVEAGARMVTGLVGDVQYPVMGNGAAAWEGENTEADDAGITFSNVKLQPKRLSTTVAISKQLLVQDSVGAENAIRNEIINAIAQKLENTVLGSAAASATQPAGIFNGQSATFTTFADLCGIEADVENAKFIGEKAYIVSPSAKATLRGMIKGTNGTGMVWENGEIDGTKAISTGNVTGNKVAYGQFDQLVIGQWGALDIVVDPYTRAKFAEVVLTVNAWFDAKLLRAGAVKCATYSAPSA
jgi:HK97 family phage major capsid protein